MSEETANNETENTEEGSVETETKKSAKKSAMKRVMVLCGNIHANGEKHLMHDVIEIPEEEYKAIQALDKEAGRKARIKITKDPVGKAADAEEEDGEE